MLAGGERSSRRPVEDSTAVFMTSTYLILLAFFVVLTSVSSYEPAKSEEVLASVTRAFGTGPSEFRGASGAGKEAEGLGLAVEHHRAIGRLIETAIQAAKVDHIQPDGLMQITIPASALFAGELVRADASALLESVGRMLRVPSGRHRHQVEFIESGAAGDGIGSSSDIRRAGALARALLAAGAPAGAVSIGLRPGDPDEVRFVFRAVEPGRDRVSFRLGEL